MTFRLTPEQICRVNRAVGGDGIPRDPTILPLAIAVAYGLVWSPRTQQWELEYPDPLDRAIHLLIDLIRYRTFSVSNTMTAILLVDIILATEGITLTLDPDKAALWAETCAHDHMRAPLWMKQWLLPWIKRPA